MAFVWCWTFLEFDSSILPNEIDSSLQTAEMRIQESTELAAKESVGFFSDIPDTTWKRRKRRFRLTQPNYENTNDRLSNRFWANNFEPEFTCPDEFRIGKLGDGGKWVCDPQRIPNDTGTQSKENTSTESGSCIVYSIGSNGNFMFEKGILEHVSPSCEIHTFDCKKKGRKKDFAEEARKIPGVTFHHTGLGPATKEQPNFKRFNEIIQELKHESKVIDVMKIDCERCEYAQFQEWLEDWKQTGVLVRQVLMEVHNSDMPGVVNLFNAFQKDGYVMFHKEANYYNEGNAIEAAWIKLDNSFQSDVM